MNANSLSNNKGEIVINILFCVLCCVLGIIDHLNAIEYYLYADFQSNFFKVCCFIFIIVHPVVLFLYYIIALLYMSYISDHDFSELTADEEYYEMIFFREKVRGSNIKRIIWILPLTIYLTPLTYLKFFPLYSLKFLLESPRSLTVFKNVITTTLYHSVIIQSVFQSLPQIILQVMNNLLIKEDKHNMRGVFNFSTLFSLAFIGMIVILYYRDKPISKSRSGPNAEGMNAMTSFKENNNKLII